QSQPAGTRYWYGEHDNTRGAAAIEVGEALTGGIGACSTDDFVDWRLEGIVLHYANVSDMVLGREPEGGMALQQPKVDKSGSNSYIKWL
ncbi:unnamed protein product, partial [Sphacelaria rigidula]